MIEYDKPSMLGKFRIVTDKPGLWRIERCIRDGYIEKDQVLVTQASWFNAAAYKTVELKYGPVFSDCAWIPKRSDIPEGEGKLVDLHEFQSYGRTGRYYKGTFDVKAIFTFSSKEQCKTVIDNHLEGERKKALADLELFRYKSDNEPEWYP